MTIPSLNDRAVEAAALRNISRIIIGKVQFNHFGQYNEAGEWCCTGAEIDLLGSVCTEAAKQVLSHLTPPARTDEASGWRGIASAPGDGTEILVFCDDTKEYFVVYYNDSWQYAVSSGGQRIACLPTHWMPLPAPPAGPPEPSQTETSGWQIGTQVVKVTGDYHPPGEVRGWARSRAGTNYTVVEHDYGMLHIYKPEQLAVNPAFLCEDEGCPHFGTPHVCVDRSDGAKAEPPQTSQQVEPERQAVAWRERLMRLFEDHYWDSFASSGDKALVLKHIRSVLSMMTDAPPDQSAEIERFNGLVELMKASESAYETQLTAARAEIERLIDSNAKLRSCLGFFASVIKSGEPWTDSCEKSYCEALASASRFLEGQEKDDASV